MNQRLRKVKPLYRSHTTSSGGEKKKIYLTSLFDFHLAHQATLDSNLETSFVPCFKTSGLEIPVKMKILMESIP